MTRTVRSQPIAGQPLYARVLRLRHLAPSGLLCFVFLEGALVLGVLLALAELVSWWGVLVLPFTVALMVKFNDLVAGAFTPRPVAGETASARAAVLRPARITHSEGHAASASTGSESYAASASTGSQGYAASDFNDSEGYAARGATDSAPPGVASGGRPVGSPPRDWPATRPSGDGARRGTTYSFSPADDPGAETAVTSIFARGGAGASAGQAGRYGVPAGETGREASTGPAGGYGTSPGAREEFAGQAGVGYGASPEEFAEQGGGRYGASPEEFAGQGGRYGMSSGTAGGLEQAGGGYGAFSGPGGGFAEPPTTRGYAEPAAARGYEEPSVTRNDDLGRPARLAPIVSRDPAAVGYGPTVSPEFMTGGYRNDGLADVPAAGTLAPGTFMAGASGYGHPYAPSGGAPHDGQGGEPRPSGGNTAARRPWADQLDVRQQVARQAAARRYE